MALENYLSHKFLLTSPFPYTVHFSKSSPRSSLRAAFIYYHAAFILSICFYRLFYSFRPYLRSQQRQLLYYSITDLTVSRGNFPAAFSPKSAFKLFNLFYLINNQKSFIFVKRCSNYPVVDYTHMLSLSFLMSSIYMLLSFLLYMMLAG